MLSEIRAASFEDEIFAEFEVQDVSHRVGVGDNGYRPVIEIPAQQVPRIFFLLCCVRQRILKPEAPGSDEVVSRREYARLARLV